MDFEFNTRHHAMIGESINQANEFQFIIDDLLAADHFRQSGETLSEETYLDYIKKHQSDSLSNKCRDLLSMPGVERLLNSKGVDIAYAKEVLLEWRLLRNIFAHGLIVVNSSNNLVLYHKGLCYDIESHVEKFFKLNRIVLGIVSALESLESQFRGKPVFNNSGNDPDHPIYA